MLDRWQQSGSFLREYSVVREFLRQAEYSEQAVCDRLGLRGLHDYLSGGQRPAPSARTEGPDALDILIRVFFEGYCLDRHLVERFVPSAVSESMEALGILCVSSADAGQFYSPVALYPLCGLYIASDRWKNPDGSTLSPMQDYVFPAMHPLTYGFLESLPQSPCDRFLELCSGTAIAALSASARFARHSWAVDITRRSTQFGEFNRRLNQLSNVTVLQGNLYEPLGDARFDRIVAHPPYVPALEPGAIYADGGEDGESITRAVVQGLPRFLEPDGRFYCATMGVERVDEPYEQRVRQWLGAEQADFDVLFIAERSQTPAQFAYRATRNSKGDWEKMRQWRTHLGNLKVRSLVNGMLVIQRKGAARSGFTVRRQKGEGSRAAEAEWLWSWETMLAGASGVDLLLRSRPLASPNFELHVVYARRNGALTPLKHKLKAAHPFAVEYECEAWMATLVARCDGKTTGLELVEEGTRDQWIPPGMANEQFAAAIGGLVSGGILEIEGFEPPQYERPTADVFRL